MIMCAIDTGKRWSKGVALTRTEEIVRLKNATSVEKLNNQHLEAGVRVMFEKEDYIVGEESNVINSDNSRIETKLTPDHKICTLTLIAQLIDEAGYDRIGEHIALGINVPISDFKINGKSEEYEQFYTSEDAYKITVNGHKYSFYIDATIPFYEGAGTLVRYSDKCEGQDVMPILFGSLNTTFVYFEDMVPKNGWSDSLDNGCNIFINNLTTRIKETKLSERQIQRILEGDKMQIKRIERNFPGIIDMIKEAALTEIKLVFQKILDLGAPIKNAYIITSGGGVHIYESTLEKYLEEEGYDYFISDDCVYDDVIGMLTMVASYMSDIEE